jgi:hypothetical protein
MEDKELFEKVEKTFNLKQLKKIDETFSKGNFKKLLNEVLTPKDPSSGGGSSLLGQIGSAVKYLSPTQARMRKAQAQQAEIATAKARQELMANGKKKESKVKEKPSDKKRLDRYENDMIYRRVWDAYRQGKERELDSKDIAHYTKIENEIKKTAAAEVTQQAKEAGKKEAQKEIFNKALTKIEDQLKNAAPGIYKYIVSDKNKSINLYKKVLVNSDLHPQKKPTNDDINILANALNKAIDVNPNELPKLRAVIQNDDRLPSSLKSVILKSVYSKIPKKDDTAVTKKTVKRKPSEIIRKKIKEMAEANDRTYKEQIDHLNKKASEFKVGDTVEGKKGGIYTVVDYDTKTGTVIVQSTSKSQRKSRFFARDLNSFMKEPQAIKK